MDLSIKASFRQRNKAGLASLSPPFFYCAAFVQFSCAYRLVLEALGATFSVLKLRRRDRGSLRTVLWVAFVQAFLCYRKAQPSLGTYATAGCTACLIVYLHMEPLGHCWGSGETESL